MSGLDFDKMDDLELFVRHFRHKIANSASGQHRPDVFPITPEGIASTLTEAIDAAWAEVSVRRERRAAGLDFPFGSPPQVRPTLVWQPAAINGQGWVEFAELPGSKAAKIIICRHPGPSGYDLKIGDVVLPAGPFASIPAAKRHAALAMDLAP